MGDPGAAGAGVIRVPLPGADLGAERLALPAEAAHYLRRVRRLGAGDRVRVFDGEGREAEAVLVEEGEALVAERAGPVVSGRRAAPVTLVYGLPKGEKLDAVARQVTELGVARLILLDAARSVVKLDGARAEKRRERLARVMAEAARQSDRADTPVLVGPLDLAGALAATADCAARWVLHPHGGGALDAVALGVAPPIAVFVGPEGGFSPGEVAAMTAAGVRAVRLGCPILRTETAAPVAVALALDRLGVL
ncbi:MAG: 16S rRNA (uracil(1498)-N(3))-methyltransferase [Myxococcales bacterium]|nr:16S rRNA (uracil(1498)-N(3))-methyltransferase [Myxococcales bacterium]